MIVHAAIDLRAGRVVQLVGGQPDHERVSLPDPAAVARDWVERGFPSLHVVDLDAALGIGDNSQHIRRIVDVAGSTPVQVGGGVRTTERAAALIADGTAAVVLGTRAIREPRWLEQVATRWPDRVILAADVRDEDVVISGWTEPAGMTGDRLLRTTAPLPLRAILVTDVGREGSMAGIDLDRFRRLVTLSPHPLIASGGVAGPADLAGLAETGVAGVVVGMALYTGALDATAALEFCP